MKELKLRKKKKLKLRKKKDTIPPVKRVKPTYIQRAIEEVIADNTKMINGIIRRHIRKFPFLLGQSEDLASMVYLHITSKINDRTLQVWNTPRNQIKKWVSVIAKNLIISHIRGQRTRLKDMAPLPDFYNDIDLKASSSFIETNDGERNISFNETVEYVYNELIKYNPKGAKLFIRLIDEDPTLANNCPAILKLRKEVKAILKEMDR